MPARPQHGENVFTGSIGPFQMVEYLIRDDQIERLGKNLSADVELWKLRICEGAKSKMIRKALAS
jgi:hypothetical protein